MNKMKTVKMCFLFLALVLIVLEPQSPCSAYKFSLGQPSDETIDFRPMEQYMEIRLIIHDSEFEMQFVGNSIVFRFTQGDLPVKYKDRFYNDKTVDIYINEDEQGHYISSIRVL
jgi:hypothetical protein